MPFRRQNVGRLITQKEVVQAPREVSQGVRLLGARKGCRGREGRWVVTQVMASGLVVAVLMTAQPEVIRMGDHHQRCADNRQHLFSGLP